MSPSLHLQDLLRQQWDAQTLLPHLLSLASGLPGGSRRTLYECRREVISIPRPRRNMSRISLVSLCTLCNWERTNRGDKVGKGNTGIHGNACWHNETLPRIPAHRWQQRAGQKSRKMQNASTKDAMRERSAGRHPIIERLVGKEKFNHARARSIGLHFQIIPRV